MIQAGKLNRQLTLYRPVKQRSRTGAETQTWSNVATVWAERQSLNLREVNRMAGIAEAQEAKFVIRYRPDVTTSFEVACDKRRYSVVAVDEVGNREGLALLVRAI
ncbi:phage head closure protein [Sphingomonas sp. WKB10]|nr:phage head closure protein [Sphingomonas sp. WKB10]